jgi:uncharacterized protein YbjT (DUF2867 family)
VPIERIHAAGEQRLRESGMSYTILKANFFMQNFFGLASAIQHGVLPMPTGAARCSLVDARDIARVAARALTQKGHENQEYTLTGPESLSHAEAAQILSRVLARPVTFTDVPAEGFKQGGLSAGMPEWLAQQLTEVYVEVFARGVGDVISDAVPRVTGRPATSLADFARDHLAVFTS